ncbi:hypothetical protein EJ06DRAFT_520530 [Trichodelitschia bisporula]|uniref:Pleckstrin homology domain-containing protein n=1 Tax=Trichodelitschia bisporula TaxID=703511 RepID=A0A6G1I3D3_9PEZI|nr:hypothetical protein EJ06DRAFT_520530 [Trichodelitschia bisporula]
MATSDYFGDLEAVGSGTALPSPVDTPYQTPMISRSRRSSRPGTRSRAGSSSPPPLPSSSPPPMPHSSPGTNNDEYKNNDNDANDDSVLCDPRRFTPTLHASLVSEILNLRRELDSKHKFIEDLEGNLQAARNEKEDIAEQLSNSDKDRRTLKRQFQQLEHGTLAALEEMAKDRDDTKESNVDLKAKLEAAQKRIRTQEEDSERRHAIWEKEKDAWDLEKRSYERRVHITETRLKTVLEELAAQHEAAQFHLENGGAEGEEEDNTKDSGVGEESDTASITCSPRRKVTKHRRTMSASSRRSLNRLYRFSQQSAAGGDPKGNGISLADELQLDEEDEYLDDLGDEDEELTEQEIRARRAMESRQSHYHDEKAKRILGLMSEHRGPYATALDFDLRKSAALEAFIGEKLEKLEKLERTPVEYVDTGIQFSPPPSPPLAPVVNKLPPVPEMPSQEIEANQRKKRVSPTPPLVDRGQQMSPTPPTPQKASPVMVSAAMQTIDSPPSPPATPAVSPPNSPLQPLSLEEQSEPVSVATQTDIPEPKTSPKMSMGFGRAPAPAPIPIPAIAIIPPGSAPSSPKETMLPPNTKNISTQTTFSNMAAYVSTSVQTEEIRTDQRLAKLPPHLLPSYITSNPPTPEFVKGRISREKSPVTRPHLASIFQRSASPNSDHIPSSPPPLPSPTSPPGRIDYRYPGNNDNGPLFGERFDGPRRPFRNSSLFAGFEDDIEEDEPQKGDEDSKSSTFQTPSMSSRALKHIRHFGTRPSPVPEDKEVESKPRTEPEASNYSQSITSGRSSLETRSSFEKSKLRSGGLARQTSIRRSALIQSGTAAHAHRSRTPSIASVGSSHLSNKSIGPPFPVPARDSSRRLFPQSKSEGSQSPTPRSGGLFGSRRQPRHQVVRKDSLRKVRSATVIQRSNSRGRQRSRSPPIDPVPLSPSYPPMPQDNVTNPKNGFPVQDADSKALTDANGLPSGNVEAGRASQGSVIDAIAATMVGEWMWKYVRRRKSFGVPESPQEVMGRPGTDGSVNVTGNGVRHKRWVWLSPYERAVMWSTKQPASNSALMGKNGRKLVIQSVLDVRDDTPLPKNHGIAEPFNRSILILTPARALKFTAMSRERHYTWLTALSFLAHSPMLAPGLAPPPPPEELDDAPLVPLHPNTTSLRRGGPRDSVRLAKDKSRPTPGVKRDLTTASTATPSYHSGASGPAHHHDFGAGSPARAAPVPDAAEPPSIPRFPHHGRKRSMTGPRAPPSALRALGYATIPGPHIGHSSAASAASSDFGSPSVSIGPGSWGGVSARTSDVSSVGRTGRAPLLDEVARGWRRME